VPPAPPNTDAVIDRIGNAALARVLHRAYRWQAIQEAGIAALEVQLFIRALRIPKLRASTELARCHALDEAVGEVVS
jgi:hypothetical protein